MDRLGLSRPGFVLRISVLGLYFLYYLRFVLAYGRGSQPGKPAFLVWLVTDLPEYLVKVRGPLVLSLMFYKAPQISVVVSRSLDLSLHYSCCAKLLRRRGSVYAVLLSLLVVSIEQAPSMYIWTSDLFSTPSFSSKFNPNVTQGLGEAPSSRDPIKLSAGWKLALHWIVHAGSHFLIDQITLLLVGCSLVVSGVLSRFNGQVNKLRLPSNEPVGTICMERHAQFVGELVVSYEEVRQLWRNVNKEFMLLFAALFGLDVTIMLGYVVSTVSMIVTGEDYSLISLWRETSQAISAAVRLLLVSVPLVLVHEKDGALQEELVEYEVRMLSALRSDQSGELKLSIDTLRRRMRDTSITFQAGGIFYVTRNSLLTMFTLIVTFALVGRDLLK